MYSIKRSDYGLKLTFSGVINLTEMIKWRLESEIILPDLSDQFSVLVDMRDLQPLPAVCFVELEKGQKLYQKKGAVKSVFVFNNENLLCQITRVSFLAAINEGEFYLDASKIENWEEIGIKWLQNGIYPQSANDSRQQVFSHKEAKFKMKQSCFG